MERALMNTDSRTSSSLHTVRALTVMAPDIRPKIVPYTLFRTAGIESVSCSYDHNSTYWYWDNDRQKLAIHAKHKFDLSTLLDVWYRRS